MRPTSIKNNQNLSPPTCGIRTIGEALCAASSFNGISSSVFRREGLSQAISGHVFQESLVATTLTSLCDLRLLSLLEHYSARPLEPFSIMLIQEIVSPVLRVFDVVARRVGQFSAGASRK
jgi:hypothetical protein